MKQEIITELKQYLPTERILEQEPMSRHTTFRVGGPARLFLEIATQEELKSTIQLLNHAGETYYLLGNGSNLLVSDKGYDGIILHLAKEFNHIEIKIIISCTVRLEQHWRLSPELLLHSR